MQSPTKDYGSRLENWYVGDGDVLYGQVFGDPRFSDGDPIRTSRVVEWDSEKRHAVTKNTRYILGKPLRKDDGYKSRPVEDDSLLDAAIAVGVGLSLNEEVGGLGDTPTPSTDSWAGSGGEFSGGGASGSWDSGSSDSSSSCDSGGGDSGGSCGGD